MKLKNQKLYSAFFRETKTFYQIKDLRNLLELEDSSKETAAEHAERIYNWLLKHNVIKSCTEKQFELNELPEEELIKREEENPSINNGEKGFFFRFVGVVYVDDCVIKVYPKYINLNKSDDKPSPFDFKNADLEEQKSVERHFSKTLRVIRSIKAKTQDASLNNQNKENYNHIGMQIFLLEDYYRNGLYQNKETIIETNGEGEIDWDKTINETTAIVKNKKPYYVELQTINTRSNEFDYFKMLHESILCQCSKTLRKADLLTYLGMTPCELTGMPLSSFGDVSYIKYKLQQEIRTQFITKKRNQLISLLTYISETTGNKAANTLKLFGSYHFEHEWEVVCKTVFDDLYKNDFRFNHLTLGESPSINDLLREKYLKEDTEPERTKALLNKNFRQLIEKVSWNMNGVECIPDGTLTPDLICIDEKDHFYILDAKYYLIKVNSSARTIENQPGIQDVLKQFAYERAYNDFLKDYQFFYTVNAFIMPSLFSTWRDKKEAIAVNRGFVNFKLMQNAAYNNLGALQVLDANPNELYDCFLQKKPCLSLLTKILEKNNLLHYINRRITQDGTDIGYTLVGYLRESYADQINDNDTFIFYFYEHKEFSEIELHPEILRCSRFKGLIFNFTEEGIDARTVKSIVGTVKPEIKKVTSFELDEMLLSRGITKKHNDKVSFYYCMTIENAKKVSISNAEFIELQKKVQAAPGNYLLRDHAPKVIEHE